MPVSVNLFGDCTSAVRGTGLGNCLKEFGDVVGVDIITKGTTWSSDPTEQSYKDDIQGLVSFPLNNVYNFEQNTPDNDQSTGNTGLKNDIRAGKPEFAFMFDAGYCFHKNIYDKGGKNKWDLAIKFETGILYASNVAETEIKGFDVNLFSVSTFKFQQGTDPEMTTVNVQFSNATELNQRGVFYTWDELGFDGTLQNGAINAHLEYQTAPTATTTVSVKVLDECNRSVNVLGLADPNEWGLGGTQASSTTITGVVYNSSTEAYDLTVSPTLVSADTVQPFLQDVSGSWSSVAENSSGEFYKGQAPSATIA